MTSAACPICEKITDLDLNFCIHCFEQIKCIDCRNDLRKGAPRCLHCGKSIMSEVTQAIPQNTVHLEEKSERSGENYSSFRRLIINANDSAIPSFTAAFPSVVNATSDINMTAIPETKKRNALPETSTMLESHEIENKDVKSLVDELPISLINSSSTIDNEIGELFEINSAGQIISKQHDYKGKSRKDQQERFTLLFAAAHQEMMKSGVSREKIYSAARAAKLHDANMSRYMPQILAENFFPDGDDIFKLNRPGKDMVRMIIAEIMDPEICSGMAYWESGPKTTRNRSSLSKDDQIIVKEWLAVPSKFDQMDIRFINKNSHHVVFAIWIITNGISVVKSVSPLIAFDYYKKKFETMTLSYAQFSREITRESIEPLLGHTDDKKYFLTQKGDSLVESWLKEQGIEMPYKNI